MKQLKKQWNKVTALLLTLGMVFGLFAAVPVQAEDGNASGSTIFDVKIVHTNDIHARVEEDDYNQVIGMDRLSGIAQALYLAHNAEKIPEQYKFRHVLLDEAQDLPLVISSRPV